jgi:hypothetical protein
VLEGVRKQRKGIALGCGWPERGISGCGVVCDWLSFDLSECGSAVKRELVNEDGGSCRYKAFFNLV